MKPLKRNCLLFLSSFQVITLRNQNKTNKKIHYLTFVFKIANCKSKLKAQFHQHVHRGKEKKAERNYHKNDSTSYLYNLSAVFLSTKNINLKIWKLLVIMEEFFTRAFTTLPEKYSKHHVWLLPRWIRREYAHGGSTGKKFFFFPTNSKASKRVNLITQTVLK